MIKLSSMDHRSQTEQFLYRRDGTSYAESLKYSSSARVGRRTQEESLDTLVLSNTFYHWITVKL